MGYNTYVTINIGRSDGKSLPAANLSCIKDFLRNEMDMSFEDWGDEVSLGDCRGYDREKDMLRISTRFPEILFVIYGDGDDSDDLWYEYWQNGKYQYISATFEDFNRRLMIAPDNETPLPDAYISGNHPKRFLADDLFNMDDTGLLEIGKEVFQGMTRQIPLMLDIASRECRDMAEAVRAAYDADNADAMLKALTGKTMEELMGRG